jgi:hypothetical protein
MQSYLRQEANQVGMPTGIRIGTADVLPIADSSMDAVDQLACPLLRQSTTSGDLFRANNIESLPVRPWQTRVTAGYFLSAST